MPSFQTFKDLSITFKKHPVSDDLVQVKDKAAIIQSITALLLTNKGERPFNSQLGSDISRMLFEPMDYATAGSIRSAVADCIKRYEPRIDIDSISCYPVENTNSYQVEMSFRIRGRDDSPVAIEFFLERTR